MKYIEVKWAHDFGDEPIWLYSELNDDLRETRKVEIFRDGTAGFASHAERAGGTRLSVEPLPPLAEIASDPQFDLVEIELQEFEDAWAKRFDHPRHQAATAPCVR